MINVKIGQEERRFDGKPQWIQEQLEGRRREGRNVCVRVSIKCGGIDMGLSTPACSGGSGGGRPPNNDELEIFRLWEKFNLNRNDYSTGNLIAFLKQVEHLCN